MSSVEEDGHEEDAYDVSIQQSTAFPEDSVPSVVKIKKSDIKFMDVYSDPPQCSPSSHESQAL